MVAGPAKMVTNRCHTGRLGYERGSSGDTSSASVIPLIWTKPPNGIGPRVKSVSPRFHLRMGGPNPMLKRSTRILQRRATT